ncbi:hypothetical protein B4U80_13745 [Leptotrombidium deliense]|uniref:PID domain-containing protein n=1 Tax=Leptotrombidium deliense TaxID=299467 RepID=A0A443SH51_9ACAR|nr:hypothetical protein B4U80_13745 [Leptotrombidium deliense]
MEERLEDVNEDAARKFADEGVVFKGKLFGIDPVSGPRGDKMCQNAMQRLKAIAKKAKGTHKERILISISVDGIKVSNEKTGDLISHQKINLISYISRDANDTRSFGYVYGSPETGHQFIGFKMEKSAIPVMKTIGELFKYVYEKRKHDKCDNNDLNERLADAFSEINVSGNKDITQVSTLETKLAKLSSNGSACKNESVANRYASWEAFNDDDTGVSKPENAAVKEKKTEFPTLRLPVSPKRTRSKKQQREKPVELESPFGLTSSTEFEKDSPIPNIFESSLCDVMFTNTKLNNMNTTSNSTTDRYAAFAEINNEMPSLFDRCISSTSEANGASSADKTDIDLNSSTVSSPDLWNKALESSQSSLSNLNLFASLPSPQKPSRSPRLSREPEVMFSELDPLSSISVEQYFDKNVFFQINKKPCLNELDSGSQKSLDSSFTEDKFNSVSDPFGSVFDKNVCTSSAFVSSSSSSPPATEGRPSSSASVVSRNPFVSETSSESNDSFIDCVFPSPVQQRMCANNAFVNSIHQNNEIASCFETSNSHAFMATVRKLNSPFNPFTFGEEVPEPPPRPPPRDSTPNSTPPPIPPRPSSSLSNVSIPAPPLPKRKPVNSSATGLTSSQSSFQSHTAVKPNLANPFAPSIPSPLRKTKQRTQLLLNKSNTLPERATVPTVNTSNAFDPFNSSFVDCKLTQMTTTAKSSSELIERQTWNTPVSNFGAFNETVVPNGPRQSPTIHLNSTDKKHLEENAVEMVAKSALNLPTSQNRLPNGGSSNYSNIEGDHISPPERNIFKGNIDAFANDDFFN